MHCKIDFSLHSPKDKNATATVDVFNLISTLIKKTFLIPIHRGYCTDIFSVFEHILMHTVADVIQIHTGPGKENVILSIPNNIYR